MINKIWKVLKDFQLVNEHNDQIVLLGLRRLISTIADFGFAILCSVLLGNVVVGLIFEIAYMILRIYAGGYHADNERICMYMTYTSTLISILCIFYLLLPNQLIHLIIFISAIILIMTVPVEHENKRLNNKEKQIYRKNALCILFLEVVFYCMFMVLKQKLYAKSICMAVVLVSVGILAALFSKKKTE